MSSSPQVAVFPGTFDPVTLGHLDIIVRAAALTDQLVVAVSSAGRSFMFTTEERVTFIGQALKEHGVVEVLSSLDTKDCGVVVLPFEGLLVRQAKAWRASLLVRGVRGSQDVAYEMTMAHANRDLAPKMETVFLPTSSTLHAVSASLVREVSSLAGDVSKWVPPNVLKALSARQSK